MRLIWELKKEKNGYHVFCLNWHSAFTSGDNERHSVAMALEVAELMLMVVKDEAWEIKDRPFPFNYGKLKPNQFAIDADLETCEVNLVRYLLKNKPKKTNQLSHRS